MMWEVVNCEEGQRYPSQQELHHVKVKFLDDYYIITLQTVFHHHHPS